MWNMETSIDVEANQGRLRALFADVEGWEHCFPVSRMPRRTALSRTH